MGKMGQEMGYARWLGGRVIRPIGEGGERVDF